MNLYASVWFLSYFGKEDFFAQLTEYPTVKKKKKYSKWQNEKPVL